MKVIRMKTSYGAVFYVPELNVDVIWDSTDAGNVSIDEESYHYKHPEHFEREEIDIDLTAVQIITFKNLKNIVYSELNGKS